MYARTSDLLNKLVTVSINLKVAVDCLTAEVAANSAANLISEFLLQVCSFFVMW